MVVGIIIGVIVAVILLVVILLWSYYNKFVTLRNRIENSVAQIDVQLKKRSDLVPTLVNVVKGYAKHESKIMTEVTKARELLVRGGSIQQKVKAGDQLQSALGRIFAIAENYPNLKANENFLQLQTELAAIEDKVAYSRQYYNDSVLSLENASETFPGVFFFNLFKFEKKDYLKIPASAQEMPKVEF
jgi:LemA protein